MSPQQMSSWDIPPPESGRGESSLTFAFPLERTKLPRARHSSVVSRPGYLPRNAAPSSHPAPKVPPLKINLISILSDSDRVEIQVVFQGCRGGKPPRPSTPRLLRRMSRTLLAPALQMHVNNGGVKQGLPQMHVNLSLIHI